MLRTGACALRKSASGRALRPPAAAVAGASSAAPRRVCAFSPTIRPTRSSRSVSPIRRSATLMPSYMTAIRSQTRNRSCSRWVISTIATPRSRQAADQAQHGLDLGHRQRRGRLVHDQDARLEGGGAADRDRLALAAGELGHQRPQIGDVDLEGVEHAAWPPRSSAACRAGAGPAAIAAARGRGTGCRRRRSCRRARGPGRPSRSPAPAPRPGVAKRTGSPSSSIVPASGT